MNYTGTMSKHFLVLVALLLAACAPDETAVVPTETPQSSSSSVSSAAASSASAQANGPSVQSLDAFASLRLEGTGLVLGNVLADNEAYTRYSIRYDSNGVGISGIMNIPKGPGPFPLLILNHGYIDPKVYTQGRGLKREQDYLARQGFAILHTDYRGHGPSDPNPDTTEIADGAIGYSIDSANAILAVRAAHLPSVDASKVGMLGHSMGGGVTMNVAVAHPELIDAVVLYAPVNGDAYVNFLRWRADSEDAARDTLAALKTRPENPAGWDAISYGTMVDSIDDPIALFHGTADKDVPIAWSDALSDSLKTSGKDISYTVYAGEGHEFGPKWTDFMQKTTSFFRERL